MYEGKWTATVVRKTFLDYFAERGHTIGTIIQFTLLKPKLNHEEQVG